MKVLSIINQKGGVGKSTTAQAIGQGLADKGNKVLLIDLDPQGNLTYSTGADSTKGYGTLGILQRPETIKQEISAAGTVDIIASCPALAGADSLISETGKEYRLQEALELVQGDYTHCIIDTPPALGIVTINALTASDFVIVPAQADIFSLQGIGQLHKTIETVKKYCNSKLKVLGIVLTRYNSRAILTRELTEMTKATAEQLNTKVYTTVIRECTAIKEAQAVKQSIYSYAPKSNATADYSNLLEEILKDI